MTVSFRSSDVLKFVEFALLIAILGLLIWSQPWNSPPSNETRKITVSGESVLEAVPDEYSFSPYFEAKGTDEAALKEQLTTQANDAIAALKELGVPEKDIKLDVSSYDQWYWLEGEEGMLTALIQIETADKDMAQKIQDYFLNTSAKGQLTPQATFSEAKQKELSAQAVEQAIADAKAKAERQATQLGVKVGKVIEVSESSNDSVYPMSLESTISSRDAANVSLPVLVGQNEYRGTVSVTYELQ